MRASSLLMQRRGCGGAVAGPARATTCSSPVLSRGCPFAAPASRGRSRLQLLNFKEKSPGSDQPPKPAATIPGAAQPPEPLTPQQQDAPASPATASGTNGTHGLPAAQQATAATPTDYPPGFVSRRLLCFIGITLGYMGLYFTRGSLTYTAPVMVGDASLGITIRDIGAMTSAFPLAYGISKFLGGVLGTKFSPRTMLGGGLAVTALVNLAFGASGHSVALLTGLWFLNGALQGIGAPASASLLTRWFASRERGTYWGLWNTGANVGGFLTPVVVGYMAKHFGWQWGMWAPGLAGLTVAMFTLAAVRDSPEAAGYPPPEAAPAPAASATAAGGAAAAKPQTPSIRAALAQVLAHPGTWLLAFTYFFVYIVRQGATSWLVFYLMATKGATDAAQAAVTVSGLELGGLVGGTLSGFLSDARIRAAGQDPSKGHVGQRVQIVMGYVAATFGVLAALRAVPPEAKWAQWLTIAALGFCIYGPHMLIGLCGAELVDKQSVGASQGVLGLVAYLGAANAGLPLSWVVNKYGWDGFFGALGVAAAAALVLLSPLANARSYQQRKADAAGMAPAPA